MLDCSDLQTIGRNLRMGNGYLNYSVILAIKKEFVCHGNMITIFFLGEEAGCKMNCIL